jgi:2,3-bisphosphoglycerate-independent phosphoglycerate mutase
MSAAEVTRLAKEAILSGKYALVVVNYANPDMVGHTGSLPATIKAVEATDAGVGDLLSALRQMGGKALVCADHGNAEQMWDEENDQPHTAHTTNPVPIVFCAEDLRGAKLREMGILADVVPTLCALTGIPTSAGMDGVSLLR